MNADLFQSGADHGEMPWWLSFLQLLFQQREKTCRICSTTVLRRLPSGMVVTLTAFPTSANRTTIECNIFANNSPTEAKLETLKRKTSAELDRFVAQSQEHPNQAIFPSMGLSLSQRAQISVLLETHLDEERREGTEIHPAARSQNFSTEGKADDDCKEISSSLDDVFLTCLW